MLFNDDNIVIKFFVLCIAVASASRRKMMARIHNGNPLQRGEKVFQVEKRQAVAVQHICNYEEFRILELTRWVRRATRHRRDFVLSRCHSQFMQKLNHSSASVVFSIVM